MHPREPLHLWCALVSGWSHAILRTVLFSIAMSSLWKHPELSDHGLGLLMATAGRSEDGAAAAHLGSVTEISQRSTNQCSDTTHHQDCSRVTRILRLGDMTVDLQHLWLATASIGAARHHLLCTYSTL